MPDVGSAGAAVRAGFAGRALVGRAAQAARTARARAFASGLVRDYLERHPVARLNIGSGYCSMPGWLNTDLAPRGDQVYLDATRPFPLPSRAFDLMYSEHMIEHIPVEGAVTMLAQCFRVAKPGGRIRISTPDMARIVGLYGRDLSDEEAHYVRYMVARWLPGAAPDDVCSVVNNAFQNWGHVYLYDEARLGALLTGAGFTNVTRQVPGKSSVPDLNDLEGRLHDESARRIIRFETLSLEAVRPE